jgi:FixJ family two-component response regulator
MYAYAPATTSWPLPNRLGRLWEEASMPMRDEPDTEPTVFVVDDDNAMRDSLTWLIRSVGLTVEAYPSAEAFLVAHNTSRWGCLLLDQRLPGMIGSALQKELIERKVALPIIILTGFAEVATAVTALKRGAFDFIEKPFSEQLLLESIHRAIDVDRQRLRMEAQRACLKSRISCLTTRERQVMHLMVAGYANKVIATELDISERTVEVHRARVMQKMHASSLASLVRIGLLELLGEENF